MFSFKSVTILWLIGLGKCLIDQFEFWLCLFISFTVSRLIIFYYDSCIEDTFFLIPFLVV